MTDQVDKLRSATGAESDVALAAKLGLERSTISQWRRRGQVPVRYRALIDPTAPVDMDSYIRRSDRRSVYGDGNGRYILSAALGCIPTGKFEFGEELTLGNLGWARESLIMNVVQVVLRVCNELFGQPRCQTESEYIQLMNALQGEVAQGYISRALTRASVGEL